MQESRIAHVVDQDLEVAEALRAELRRERGTIELIASENIVSQAVMEAMGTVLTNKYAEGYPGRRFYGGCYVVDTVEQLAIDRACKLFDANFANVQPHSGAQANYAAYAALIKPGDTVCVPTVDLPCALPGSVVMGEGDTLSSLATRYRLSVAQLLRANPCLAPDDFTQGTTVKLPQ